MSFIGVTGKNPLKYMFHVQCQLPKAITAANNGADINRYRNGGYAALTLVLLPGLWTDGTHAFVVEEADDNGSGAPGTYAAVAAADILPGSEVGVYGTATTFVSITAATTVVQRIDYIGRKQWVRVRLNPSGTTTGAVYAVDAILSSPTIFPAA